MIFLNRKSLAFFKSALLQARKTNNKSIPLGASEKVCLHLRIIREDSFQTIFEVYIPKDIFSISVAYQYQRGMIPFCYADNELLENEKLFAINETDLTKNSFEVGCAIFPMINFLDSIVNSLANYFFNRVAYKNELEISSFRAIKLVFIVLVIENAKYCSWGVETVELLDHSLSLTVGGNHFNGIVNIQYYLGSNLFKINYIDSSSKRLINSQPDIPLDKLIDMIDKKVEYITEYGNK